uniref:Uncharacterized protein n=1 Tax=Corethron hystrix TaxID=216773 RepID=A0A6U5LC65_9STRA|mmetsp:Transcript_4879/g.9663  ORF Transcript_4879/g.9663 Transcript_4879/m.9663 type:complete len:189 (+) Transcript_4879:173-739(+)
MSEKLIRKMMLERAARENSVLNRNGGDFRTEKKHPRPKGSIGDSGKKKRDGGRRRMKLDEGGGSRLSEKEYGILRMERATAHVKRCNGGILPSEMCALPDPSRKKVRLSATLEEGSTEGRDVARRFGPSTGNAALSVGIGNGRTASSTLSKFRRRQEVMPTVTKKKEAEKKRKDKLENMMKMLKESNR